jgi:hypothetical protein
MRIAEVKSLKSLWKHSARGVMEKGKDETLEEWVQNPLFQHSTIPIFSGSERRVMWRF